MAYPLVRGDAIGFDLPVRAAIHGWAFPALTAAMRLITMLGSEYFLVPLAAILVWRWEKRGRAQGGLPAGGRKPERGSGGAVAQNADPQATAGTLLWARAHRDV